MLELIKKYEGLELKAYADPKWLAWDLLNKGKPKPANWGEPWTIGYGTTFYENGAKVKKTDTITKERAEELLQWYCKNKIRLPKGSFNAKQTTALYSLIYNIGQGAFDRSNCKKGIETQNWQLAYKGWKSWRKAGGHIITGLVNRRKEETDLFFNGLTIEQG